MTYKMHCWFCNSDINFKIDESQLHYIQFYTHQTWQCNNHNTDNSVIKIKYKGIFCRGEIEVDDIKIFHKNLVIIARIKPDQNALGLCRSIIIKTLGTPINHTAYDISAADSGFSVEDFVSTPIVRTIHKINKLKAFL